ncbi:hypothetical protein D2E60_10880, partial [Mycobacteroides abscessus]|uniref:hypothetical protein n=1 Tax=Mycobacteroides abscessus TaxID=36809 RepID=UPI000FEF88D1
SPDCLNHHIEESHDDVVHHVPGLDRGQLRAASDVLAGVARESIDKALIALCSVCVAPAFAACALTKALASRVQAR